VNVAATELEAVAGGFLFTEGPLWDRRGQRLLFSDIPGNRIVQWSRAKGASDFRKPSNMSNGLAWDREGRLLACEHATSRLTRTESDGRVTVLASTHQGKELNSPNDVVVKSDGAIYFTDPTYGRNDYYGVKRAPQLAFRGAYRLAADGTLTLLADDFAQPNGLCFSPDEKRLFINDTERGHIRVFDVRPDGTLGNGKVWAELSGEGPGAPDGMKLDSAGSLYCCGPGGIHVFDAAGKKTGVIQVPGGAANFAWGEDDRKSLFITAGSTLFRLRAAVPGRA
jgi:gluconolactonase